MDRSFGIKQGEVYPNGNIVFPTLPSFQIMRTVSETWIGQTLIVELEGGIEEGPGESYI